MAVLKNLSLSLSLSYIVNSIDRLTSQNFGQLAGVMVLTSMLKSQAIVFLYSHLKRKAILVSTMTDIFELARQISYASMLKRQLYSLSVQLFEKKG